MSPFNQDETVIETHTNGEALPRLHSRVKLNTTPDGSERASWSFVRSNQMSSSSIT